MKNTAFEEITKAAKELLYISETEADLTPFTLAAGTMDTGRIREVAGATRWTAVEESTLDEYFRVVPSEDKAKYAKLRKVLLDRLSGVKVFKVGSEAKKHLFVLGTDDNGEVIGLRTTVVER